MTHEIEESIFPTDPNIYRTAQTNTSGDALEYEANAKD